MLDRDAHDRAEVLVSALGADIARVDTVFGKRRCGLWVLDQQQVSVVVEVTHQRHTDAEVVELAADDRDRSGRGLVVDGDPDQLATGVCQGSDLQRGRVGVGRIGVGHRLHHDRLIETDRHATDDHARGHPPGQAHPLSPRDVEMVTHTRSAMSSTKPVR